MATVVDTTRQVLEHHLAAFGVGDLEGILSDYADDSIMISPDGPLKGRAAIRGFFDGRTKYARYYGVGGGKPGTGLWGKDPGRKLYDVDADFADQEHEWYDLADDPHEMVNLAHDPGRRGALRANYERLLEYEALNFSEPA